MSAFDTFENTVLNAMLGGGATLLGASVDVGLSTTAPNDDGTNINEPPGGAGYARVNVTNDGSKWGAAASGVKSNLDIITFAAASGGDWGLISHWVIWDGGTPKLWGILDDGAGSPLPRQVSDGDQFKFLIGQLRVALD